MDSPSPTVPPDVPITPQVVQRASPPRRGAGTRLLVVLLVLGLGVSLLVNVSLLASRGGRLFAEPRPLVEKHHSLSRRARDKVAILSVEGIISESDRFVKDQIDEIRDDEHVKAVVLRVDSPGGTVTGSDYIYHYLGQMLEERGLPMVVSMGSLAASGGYYVAMAVGDTPEAIYAEPSTWTGSIGVIIPHYNVAGLMSEWHIEDDSIPSHRLKQMGTPTRKMSEEERQIFQGLVDASFARFKSIVQAGRPRFRDHPDELDAVATGQIFTTDQAIANGLVDRAGFLEDAIERAISLAGLDSERVNVVEYRPQLGLLDTILLGPQGRAAAAAGRLPGLERLLDLSTPRAYYLWTAFPGLLESAAR